MKSYYNYKFYCPICKKRVEEYSSSLFNATAGHLERHIKEKNGNVYIILASLLELITDLNYEVNQNET